MAAAAAAGSVLSIGKTIGEVNEIAGSIAAAIEEQGAATREIADSVARAAKGRLDLFSPVPGKTSGFLAVFEPRKQTDMGPSSLGR